MKKLFLILVVAFSVATRAQVTEVSLQASGLTCSMCSKSIHKALKTLDFVDKVVANIKTYTFDLSFKTDSNIDFGMIKNKVEAAGFSVSSFVATINFDNVSLLDNQPVIVSNNPLLIVNHKQQVLNGVIRIRLLDKGFVSAKESGQIAIASPQPGIYHAAIN